MKHEIRGAYVAAWVWVDLCNWDKGPTCEDDAINDQQIRHLATEQLDALDEAIAIDSKARVVRSYLD